MKKFFIIIGVVSLAVLSCKSTQTKKSQATMQTLNYLQDYTGTELYEVYQASKTLRDNPTVWVDTISQNILMFSSGKSYKFNFKGDSLNFVPNIDYTEIHPNGLITGYGICTWVLDGKQHTIKPTDIILSEDKAIEDFEVYYKKAGLFLLIEHSSYRLKVDNTFYDFKRNDAYYDILLPFLETPEGKARFPLKEGTPRMVRLESLNQFTLKENYPLKIKDYVVKRTEKRNHPGLSSTFSDGDMHIELRMKKDTLNFKRGANDLGEGIELFQVPKKYGGYDDVMIICQEPDINNQESKTGGFFIVRPRK